MNNAAKRFDIVAIRFERST